MFCTPLSAWSVFLKMTKDNVLLLLLLLLLLFTAIEFLSMAVVLTQVQSKN